MDKSMIWKGAGIVLAAGLYVLGHYLPDVAPAMNGLAGTVVGWLALRRPGDVKE